MRFLLIAFFLLSATLTAADFPWSNAAPEHIRHAALLPDQVIDEEPCNWRPILNRIFPPMVKECSTAREAALHIAGNIGTVTGTYYSKERRKHNMNALEALTEKKISCTGQSVLLVCALRSVDIPARAVGVHTWNHIQGNHTWVEAWIDGEWHMIEFNEREFDTPWVMEYVGMLNPLNPFQRIRAIMPGGASSWWPRKFAEQKKLPNFEAEDVTARYLIKARKWYTSAGIPENTQRILIDLQPRLADSPVVEIVDEENRVVSSGRLPTLRDDMRYLTRLNMPRNGTHYLRLEGAEERAELIPSEAPIQILRLEL